MGIGFNDCVVRHDHPLKRLFQYRISAVPRGLPVFDQGANRAGHRHLLAHTGHNGEKLGHQWQINPPPLAQVGEDQGARRAVKPHGLVAQRLVGRTTLFVQQPE